MMGLQATGNKRKYEVSACNDAAEADETSCKNPRWSSEMNKENTNQQTTMTPMLINEENVETTNSIAKLEAVAVPGETTPWNCEPIVDSISKLQAVAVPGETWGSDSTRSTLATTLALADDLDDDDDDFDDDFDDDETVLPSYSPIRYPCSPNRGYIPAYPKPGYFPEPYQNCSRTPQQYSNRGYGWSQHGYYSPPYENNPQQTIRCAENGKSYFELGSTNYNNGSNNYTAQTRHIKRCCDGRNIWCNSKQCYRERRLKMMNMSMFKLARFRQASDQSLYRSVLICNTLKSIEKEIETENKQQQQMHYHHHNHNLQHESTGYNSNTTSNNGPHFNSNRLNNTTNNNNNNNTTSTSEKIIKTDIQNSNNNNSNNNSKFSDISNNNNTSNLNNNRTPASTNTYNSNSNGNSNGNSNSNDTNSVTPSFESSVVTPPFTAEKSVTLSSYDHPNHNLNPLKDPQSGRATPFPISTATYQDNDSGFGDDDCTRPINWGSVLSLSSQSALDPLNNNDLLLSADSANSSGDNADGDNSSSAATTSSSTTLLTSLTTVNTSHCDLSLTTLTTSPSSMITSSCASSLNHTTTWDFAYLDMDLGYDMFTNCYKISTYADDILNSPILEPSKVVCDTESMDTFTTSIMVGS